MLPRRSTIKPLSDVSLHKTGSRPASHDGEAEDGGLAAMAPSLTVSPPDVDRGRECAQNLRLQTEAAPSAT